MKGPKYFAFCTGRKALLYIKEKEKNISCLQTLLKVREALSGGVFREHAKYLCDRDELAESG